MSAIYEQNYKVPSNSNIGCGLAECSLTCARPSQSISQWNCNNYDKFSQFLNTRCDGEKTRYDTKTKQDFYRDKIMDSINSVTTSFEERLRDIDFWKNELEKEIANNTKETDQLMTQRDRLRLALLSLDLPTQINLDNSKSKTIKDSTEVFDDQVTEFLMKECCLINSCKELVSSTLDTAEAQIMNNLASREKMEEDLSNKTIARNLDDFCHKSTTDSSAIISYAESTQISEQQSSPEEWASTSLKNIMTSSERMKQSAQLRTEINSVLSNTSRDLREMSDRIEMAIGLRINRVQEALQNLKNSLALTNKEIMRIENAIRNCNNKIKAKQGPLKLAETRLHTHNLRPGIELCKDWPQHRLLKNWELIQEGISVLEKQRCELTNSLNSANDDKISAENEIQLKEQNLSVDRNKFLPTRRRYPNVITLLGYPN